MITKLQAEKEALQKELSAVQEEYKTLLVIMERARKLAALEEAQEQKASQTENVSFEKVENS